MAKSKVLIIIIVIILAAVIILKEAGNFLVINEKPVKSDVIIVLSGGGIERLESAIVVSSNYHMRRVKNNYSKAISNSGMSIAYCSVSDGGYDSSRWWATREDRHTTYIEYAKLAGNYFGIHGIEAKNNLKEIFSFN